MLVEPLDELLEPGARNDLGVATHQLGLDVDEGVGAIEERHDLDDASGQHDDRRRVAGGIAERDELLPFVLDRKGLDGPEPRVLGAHASGLAHPSRYFRAATV